MEHQYKNNMYIKLNKSLNKIKIIKKEFTKSCFCDRIKKRGIVYLVFLRRVW